MRDFCLYVAGAALLVLTVCLGLGLLHVRGCLTVAEVAAGIQLAGWVGYKTIPERHSW
jgi:hypothetical protein